jgi:lipopolysaccharide export LptBFGC system permease protein LptF
MENSNDINNTTIENNNTIEPEVKKKIYIVSEAQKAAQKRYYNKIKENPEFQEVRRGYSKKHYDNNKSTVIARVQRYQAKQQDLEQLERLHELQQQGLIHVHTGELTQAEYDKYNNRLLNRLAHLHLSS